MIKVRLLLAGLFVPRSERVRLQPLLAELSSQAAGSQDEWVRATAAVVGDFSGPLDMRTLMAQFPLVRDTMNSLSSQVDGTKTPAALLPQTEQYMHGNISRLPASGLAAAPRAPAASGTAARFHLRGTPAAPLADSGLASSSGGGLAAGVMVPSMGSGGVYGSADARFPVGGGAPGSADPLARRGLGGGETSMLRSRANVSHSTVGRDLAGGKQAPPTPKGGGPLPGLTLRVNRAGSRPLVGPDGQVLESPHQHLAPLPTPTGLHLPPPGGPPSGVALARRDSTQMTPRFSGIAPHLHVTSASAASTGVDTGGAYPHTVAVHSTSTAEPPASAGHPISLEGGYHQHGVQQTGDSLHESVQLAAEAFPQGQAGELGAAGSGGHAWSGDAAAGVLSRHSSLDPLGLAASDDGGVDEPGAKRFRPG